MIGVQRWDGIFEYLMTRTVGPVVKDVPEEINECICDVLRNQSCLSKTGTLLKVQFNRNRPICGSSQDEMRFSGRLAQDLAAF